MSMGGSESMAGVGRVESSFAPGPSTSAVSLSIAKPALTVSSSSVGSSGVDSPSLRIRLPNPSYNASQCSTVSSASGSEMATPRGGGQDGGGGGGGGGGSGGGGKGPHAHADAHPEFKYARSVSIDEGRPHHMIENMVHQEFERDVNDVYKR